MLHIVAWLRLRPAINNGRDILGTLAVPLPSFFALCTSVLLSKKSGRVCPYNTHELSFTPSAASGSSPCQRDNFPNNSKAINFVDTAICLLTRNLMFFCSSV